MEFKEQYLTYEEYKALGGDLDLLPFNLLEFEVRRKIDIRTQDRLKSVEEIPQAVKLCEYKMINQVFNYNKSTETAGGSNIASENTDGYSVSYITARDIDSIVKSKNAELQSVMEEYLMGIVINGEHIMYLGV